MIYSFNQLSSSASTSGSIRNQAAELNRNSFLDTTVEVSTVVSAQGTFLPWKLPENQRFLTLNQNQNRSLGGSTESQQWEHIFLWPPFTI